MSTILITVDALRADHLGQYGYERNTMPILDRLWNEGVLVRNAFANGPYTRISVPALHASTRLAHANLESLPTISGELQKSGIKTACIGTRTGFKSAQGDLLFDRYVDLGRDSYHKESKKKRPIHIRLEDRIIPLAKSALQVSPRIYDFVNKAYDSFPGTSTGFSYKGYTSAEDVTDTAIEWLNEYGSEPFFLWLHYMEGHRPYGVHDENPQYTSKISDGQIRNLMKQAGTNPEDMTIEEHNKSVDLYDSDLRYCSGHLERLLDELVTLDLWESTNLIFTSDHGEEFYEHGYYFHRNLPYDELLHVPLIIRPAGDDIETETIDEQRELIDIAPTILNFHSVEIPASFEGQDLFSGGERNVIAVGSQMYDSPVVAGRWGNRKYIYTPEQEYLFDLTKDQREERDIASNWTAVCEEYRSSIPTSYFEKDKVQEQLREPEDSVDKERLEALGYIETKD